MKNCPKEYFYAVERVLREYPERERELRMLDRFIEECCHAILPDAEASGLSVKIPSSPQEKILTAKEQNGYYCWLVRHIETVRNAMETLDHQEMQIVENLYWDDFSVSEIADEIQRDRKVVHRARTRIVRKIAPFLIPNLIFSPVSGVT